MKTFQSYIIILLLIFSHCNGQEKKESYVDCINRIHSTRDSLNKKYILSDSLRRDSIIALARQFIFTSITHDIFQYWYGTPWNFYGTTRIPQQGTIACGYFVTGVLSDVGFNIPRVRWAQLASEIFIKKMTTDIKRFHDRPISEVKNYVIKREDGLYVVGLDCHVGFIYKENDSIKFVHSNYYQPSIGVMSENFETWNPLNSSKYRVIGRILDDKMIISWLKNTKID